MYMRFIAQEKVDNKKLHEALKKMQAQLKTVNGQLNFLIKIDNEGWVAICKEFGGIVTGGANKNPSEKEIIKSLIDAIKTAFHIPINKLKISNKQKLEFPKINIVRELQLC